MQSLYEMNIVFEFDKTHTGMSYVYILFTQNTDKNSSPVPTLIHLKNSTKKINAWRMYRVLFQNIFREWNQKRSIIQWDKLFINI